MQSRAHRLTARLTLLAVLAIGALALIPNLGAPPMLDWDEATYAQVARESIAADRYLDFTWNGAPYLKKPPLLFWMVAASFRAFGESEIAARIPSLAMGLGTLAIIYLSAAETAGPIAGLLAALIALSFFSFVERGARECATDAPLIFFVTLAMYAFARSRRNRHWLALAGIACGFALLAKGMAGLIPLIAAAIAIAALDEFRALGPSALIVMFGGAAIIAAPWYAYQAVHSYPMFFTTFVGRENLMRVMSHLEDEIQSDGSTLSAFLGETRHLWPILIALLGLAIANLRSDLRDALRRPLPPAAALWLVWLAVALAAALAVQTKLTWYVLPALIPVALLGGSIIGGALAYRGPLDRTCRTLAIAALALLAIGAPSRWAAIRDAGAGERLRSTPSWAMGLKARALAASTGGGELYFAGAPLPTLVWYSAMPCHFVETSELNHVELVGASAARFRAQYHDLIMLDSDGGAWTVANLDDEWRATFAPAPSEPAEPLDDSEADSDSPSD